VEPAVLCRRGTQAELQSDALTSKLERLCVGLGDACVILIGYIGSPEGLNGESVLVEWLRERTGAKTLDLVKDRVQFHAAAGKSVAYADGQQMLAKV
jgi:hypothetical protein